ncbi:MAG TPA: hypothetical protein VGL54_10630 [Solirubrobacteraceae bacterium]|jgi:hypothetical protein
MTINGKTRAPGILSCGAQGRTDGLSRYPSPVRAGAVSSLAHGAGIMDQGLDLMSACSLQKLGPIPR